MKNVWTWRECERQKDDECRKEKEEKDFFSPE